MIVLALLLIPAAALAQEPLLVAPDGGVPLLEQLPPLLPGWVERLLSYATLLGAGLVALANVLGHLLERLRAAGRPPPAWLELVVGLLLDVGTDLGALRSRLVGAPRTPNGSGLPPSAGG